MQEEGYVFLASANYNMDTTGSVTLLNIIPRGASQSQRLKKKCWLATLEMKGFTSAGSAGTVAEGSIWIVYDKHPTGALPAITDILNSASSLSFANPDNEGRFEILFQKDYLHQGSSTAPTGDSAFPADELIRIDDQEEFTILGTTGAISEIKLGSVLLVVCGQTVAGTAAPVATLAFKVNYVDLS